MFYPLHASAHPCAHGCHPCAHGMLRFVPFAHGHMRRFACANEGWLFSPFANGCARARHGRLCGGGQAASSPRAPPAMAAVVSQVNNSAAARAAALAKLDSAAFQDDQAVGEAVHETIGFVSASGVSPSAVRWRVLPPDVGPIGLNSV